MKPRVTSLGNHLALQAICSFDVTTRGRVTLDSAFKVITDIDKVARLNRRLGKQLAKVFRVTRRREITYPSGHHTGNVYFELPSGTNVRAWSPSTNDGKLGNFLLTGDPAAHNWMEIDVQLNFPAGTYNRRMAGAFVSDENGDIFVAHRGKLTKGRAGLKKAKVFREFAARTIQAQDDNCTSTLILLTALDDPALADRLWEFAEEAREVATRIGAEKDGLEEDDDAHPTGRPVPRSPKKPPKNRDPILTLRDYFDEYAGEGHSKGHGGGKRTVEHGDIVRDLEAQMKAKGLSQKAQAIDLAIVAKVVDLFEVKTSSRTTAVYTGVGQLLIHGECIHELLELPVRRHLVLPAEPRGSHGRHISNRADIRIITFTKDGSSYRFNKLS